MNKDILEGKWTQVRGQAREWWGKLTDDDLDIIAGKRDRLVGRLQERYGWAKDVAEKEIDRRLQSYEGAGEHGTGAHREEVRR
jgi:uncharacterized protein YjbJ (UPF0337 family)